MKACITKKGHVYYVFVSEKDVTKNDCITFGKYTNSEKKAIIPLFEYGIYLDDGEDVIAVIERSGKSAPFRLALSCRKFIEAL